MRGIRKRVSNVLFSNGVLKFGILLDSGWNVDVLSDSLPSPDTSRAPTADIIVSTPPTSAGFPLVLMLLTEQRAYAQAILKGNRAGDEFILVCEL